MRVSKLKNDRGRSGETGLIEDIYISWRICPGHIKKCRHGEAKLLSAILEWWSCPLYMAKLCRGEVESPHNGPEFVSWPACWLVVEKWAILKSPLPKSLAQLRQCMILWPGMGQLAGWACGDGPAILSVNPKRWTIFQSQSLVIRKLRRFCGCLFLKHALFGG